jgi:hypothetical protein
MKKYSIVRIGHEYVVRADQQDLLKVASRRQAAKLVTDAVGLLDLQAASPMLAAEPGSEAAALSIDCDPAVMPDHSEVS